MARDDTLPPMANPTEWVRCVECKHEYELPALGEEMGCPLCGGVSWISTRIAAAQPAESRYETQQS
jgi:rRNA maturation endonuclease Nob1